MVTPLVPQPPDQTRLQVFLPTSCLGPSATPQLTSSTRPPPLLPDIQIAFPPASPYTQIVPCSPSQWAPAPAPQPYGFAEWPAPGLHPGSACWLPCGMEISCLPKGAVLRVVRVAATIAAATVAVGLLGRAGRTGSQWSGPFPHCIFTTALWDSDWPKVTQSAAWLIVDLNSGRSPCF